MRFSVLLNSSFYIYLLAGIMRNYPLCIEQILNIKVKDGKSKSFLDFCIENFYSAHMNTAIIIKLLCQ